MSLSKALQKWATIKGVRVLDMDEAKIKYGVNTLALSREVLGALQVSKVEQIQKIVRLANTYKIPLYPISGGVTGVTVAPLQLLTAA
jgi:FAD/FMN-containing dehydrogenase